MAPLLPNCLARRQPLASGGAFLWLATPITNAKEEASK
jgi:hypothetical protein